MFAVFLTDRRKKIKKIFSIFFIFAFIAVNFFCFQVHTAFASASWYDPSWGYRTAITIDHTKVQNTNQSYFPVLISTTSAAWKVTGSGGHVGQADGGDILFTSSDGTTKLNHEIELYTSTTGQLIAWVQVPTLSTSVDTVLYIYYGNAGAADQWSINNTWNDGGSNYYKGVWHLPDGTSLTANDSTSNTNNGTITGASATSGEVGGGASFNGSTNKIVPGSSSSFATVGSAFTAEIWGNNTNLTTQIYPHAVILKSDTGTTPWEITVSQQGGYQGIVIGSAGSSWGRFKTSSVPSTGNWHHIVVAYNGAGANTAGNFAIYLDGVAQTLTSANAFSVLTNSSVVGGSSGGGSSNFWYGKLDEFRISSGIARSADWVKTEYNNQNSPSTFYSSAVEESVTVPDAPTSLGGTPGNAQVSLSWTAPVNNGGSAITDYVIDYKLTSDSSWSTFADGVSTGTSGTVTGLTNGLSYDFRVSAVNAIGQGSASSQTSATPVTVPDAPTIGTATAGNAQASVTFTTPSDGGSTITGYTITSSPGGFTGTGASSPITVTGLTNGTAYTFTVTATNAVGTGSASSASNSVTPATTPDAPTAVLASVGNTQIGLSWSAPSFNGGVSISDYVIEYKLNSDSSWTVFSDGVSTGTTGTVTGLTNGSLYNFRVSASNSVGQGTASSVVNSTPITTPGAPTSAVATRGNTTASVTFSAPLSDGGSAITSYTITSSPGSISTSTNTTTGVVTGLTNGTAYTFTITATNAAGTGSGSSPSNSVTPATIPDAPTISTATAGNAQASVAFTAPPDNGGTAITGYTVTSSPGGFTGTGASSPIIVTGLTNGTAYTFTVKATNDVGDSSASSASNAATPVTTPGAPTIGTATAGNAQATVTFTAPVSNGGTAITGYTVTSSPGGIVGTGSASPITVTGLTNGTAYTFTVTATNAVGTGSASSASNSTTPITVPGAPLSLTPTAGNAQVALSWTEPTSNGGASITDYVIEYKLTSEPTTWSTFADGVSSGTSGTVTGLTNGLSYDFRVSAVNTAGQGSSSSEATAVPVTVPSAPIIGTATAGNAQVTVTFSAPVDTGGTGITSYTITSNPGNISTTTTTTSGVVTGLTNGTAYTFTVTATNAVGEGSASSASNSVTPITIPGAPTSVSATEGNTVATVTFSAPSSDGGSAITSYTITSNPGNISTTTTTTSGVVTGLTNGTAYTFTVTATNAAGTGSDSAPSNSVTLSTEPGPPVNLAATVAGSSIALTWSAPASNGGSAITDYIIEYQLTTGGSWSVFADGTSATTGATVTGLSNDTSYDFRVRAVNIIGQSTPSSFATATPGEPAQVLIQSFPDLTTPSIGTAVRITNEGSVAYEYQYTWCVTDSALNLCGGGDDVFSSSAAKLIQPSENWDTTLSSTISTPGNYYFHISVTYGSESSSANQSFTAVATFPDAPIIGPATAGNAQASVTFTPPTSNGGSAITNYTVTSNPGGLTGTGLSSPIIVTGLTNGTAYTFTMTATNAVGTGMSSSPPSNSVIPMTVPSAIHSFSASAGNAQVGLFWSAPSSDGGSPITDYVIEYKLSSDSVWSVFADAISTETTVTVTGLTNNVSYDFRVSAVNVVGQGSVNSTSATLVTSPSTNTSSGGSSSGSGYVYPTKIGPDVEIIPPTTPDIVSVTKVPKVISPTTSSIKSIKNEVSTTPTESSHITPPVKQNQTPGDDFANKETSKVPWVWIIVSSCVFVIGSIIFILRRRHIDDLKN